MRQDTHDRVGIIHLVDASEGCIYLDNGPGYWARKGLIEQAVKYFHQGQTVKAEVSDSGREVLALINQQFPPKEHK